MNVLALDRKLLRDLWEMKGQALAIAAVVAAGVTMYVTYLSNFDSLRRTQRAYYERFRFADVFVPAPPTSPLTNVNIGGETEPSMAGVWRRILYFGRGIAGKHVTALDVPAPGPYTTTALGNRLHQVVSETQSVPVRILQWFDVFIHVL